MTVSLTTRGILSISSPSITISTWGIIIVPLAFFTPYFIVNPISESNNVTLLGKRTVNLVDNIILLLAVPIAPILTSPSLELFNTKEPIPLIDVDNSITNKAEPILVSLPDDEDIFNKEDPDLINEPK